MTGGDDDLLARGHLLSGKGLQPARGAPQVDPGDHVEDLHGVKGATLGRQAGTALKSCGLKEARPSPVPGQPGVDPPAAWIAVLIEVSA